MFPRTGAEKNVRFSKLSENRSLRFHGNRETQRAIVQ
jgi:hypothetical protein